MVGVEAQAAAAAVVVEEEAVRSAAAAHSFISAATSRFGSLLKKLEISRCFCAFLAGLAADASKAASRFFEGEGDGAGAR